MATDTYDPLETYDGLPDDFDGAVRGSFFGYDTNYMSGDKLALIAEIVSDELEEPEKLLFGTGKDWEPDKSPKGTKISREGKQQYHKQSGCGLLVKAMREAGAEDVLRERIKDGLGPFDAAFYDGLNFHWERKEFVYKLDDGDKTTSRLLPTKFLGIVGEKANGAAKSSKKADAKKEEKPAKAAKEEAKSDDSDDDVTSVIEGLATKVRSKLIAKAAAADTVEEFVASVESLELVETDVLMQIAPAIFAEANAD